MADKSFEQKVREEFSQLKMKPDAEVWTHVQAGLRKEKKRRWLVWLFLFGGLTAATFVGWLVIDGRQGEGSTVLASAPQHNKAPVVSATPVNGMAAMESAGKDSIKEEIREREVKVVTSGVTDNRPGTTVRGIKDMSERGKRRVATGKTSATHTEDPGRENVSVVVGQESNAGVAEDRSKQSNTAIQNQTVSQLMRDTKHEADPQPESKPPVTADTMQVSNTKDSTPPLSSVTTAVPQKKAKKNAWEFSLSVDAGKSMLRDDILPFVTRASDLQSSSPINGGGGTSLGAGSSVPPSVYDGTGFGIQFGVKRPLNRTFSVELAAAFTQFQTKTTVGRRIDSTTYFGSQYSYNSNGYYFVNSDSTRYINRYQYLRLGASLYTSFPLFRWLSLRWQVGAGAGILVGSNGLHYDAVTRRSFQNNDLLTRVQPFLSTGFDLGIGKRPFVYIGPHWLLYTGHLTHNAGSGEHLILSSLRVSVVLPRKK